MEQLYQFTRLGAALNPRLWHPIKGAPRLARLHPDADAAHTTRGFHELAKCDRGVQRSGAVHEHRFGYCGCRDGNRSPQCFPSKQRDLPLS